MDLLATFVSIFLLISVSDAGLLSGLMGGGKKESCSSESSESKSSESESEECGCKDTCYRSYDGSCNNLKNPLWGTPNTEYIRLFNETSYSDGIYKCPELRNPRETALVLFPDKFVEDRRWTVCTPMWGQYVAHEAALTKGVLQIGKDAISCPCVNGQLTNTPPESDRCCPIKISPYDPFHGPEGTQCFNFVRTETCPKNPKTRAEQINAVTSYIDGSPIYGNCAEEANSLRLKKKGMLAYQMRNGRMYPPQAENANLACTNIGAKDNLCLKTGDVRGNQNPHIALDQTLLLRLHNDIASTLCEDINPHWDDEKCYQEARRIVIATIQHITYCEFFPIIIGEKNICGKSCDPNQCYDDDYDDCCNVGIGNEYSTAAFRLHTLVVGWIRLYSEHHKPETHLRLSDNFGNPSTLLDYELQLAVGAATQNEMESDGYYVDELKQYFFRPPNRNLGLDLAAIDIKRGRDHGLPPYTVAVKKCGLGKLTCWDDLNKYIKPETVNIMKTIYDSPDQVDLIVGGALENLLPGALTGPTFNCILVEQVQRFKKCDRYWYTNKKQKCPFTKEQLKSIKIGSTLSSLLCKYIPEMKTLQRRAFEVISKSNPLVDCDDIPCIDLNLWKDDSSSGQCD